MEDGKKALEELVAGLDAIEPKGWFLHSWRGSFQIIAGPEGSKWNDHGCHLVADCDEEEDAKHILTCSPDHIRAIAEHVAALEARALAAEKRVEELEMAVRKLLACPAIADVDHWDAEYGDPDTAAAENFAIKTLTGGKHD